MGCFNPRPTLLSGDTHLGLCETRTRPVSIHARHCCRATRRLLRLDCHGLKFQSTPDIAVGRHLRLPHQASARTSFNPRPTLLSGDTVRASHIAGFCEVSIHARHCCRATRAADHWPGGPVRVSIHARHCCRTTPRCLLLVEPCHVVSIHARHCCRATHTIDRSWYGLRLFQSTPDIAVGRHTTAESI